MDKWRLVKTMETDGAMQMAIDEAMLAARSENMVPNTLRFFTWKPPAVTIGIFQSLKQEVDAERAKEMGADIVRRYTGGGAVFHENELTYSMALSEKDVPHGIIESYEKICSGIVDGLGLLGIDAEFRPVNDIVVNGRKISGNAQTRKNGVLLQHGTILMDADVKRMFSLLKVPDEKIRDKLIKSAEERVTSLRMETGRPTSVLRLQESLVSGFERAFGTRFVAGELTPTEMKTAERLCREKYSTRGWNHWR